MKGRTVTGVFTSSSSDPSGRPHERRFVIVELSPEDADASLVPQQSNGPGVPGDHGSGPNGGKGPGAGGPGEAGSRPGDGSPVYRKAQATLVLADGHKTATTGVRNLIVDDFQQHEFHDPKTGRTHKEGWGRHREGAFTGMLATSLNR